MSIMKSGESGIVTGAQPRMSNGGDNTAPAGGNNNNMNTSFSAMNSSLS